MSREARRPLFEQSTPPSEPSRQPPPPPPPYPSGSFRRVLVIDSSLEEGLVQAIRKAAEEDGYEVVFQVQRFEPHSLSIVTEPEPKGDA